MIHLKPTCDKRRTKKDGTHPIVFRISLNGKSRDISTGLSCNSEDWDYKKNMVKPGIKEKLSILCDRIQETELNLLKSLREYERKFPNGSNIQTVKDYLCSKNSLNNSVLDFWKNEIIRMKKAKSYSNASNYDSALGGLVKVTQMNIPFESINYAWLIDTETLLKEMDLK